jgi:hypothetical protein
MNAMYVDNDKYRFIKEIDLPEVDKNDVVKMGVDVFDRQIAEKQVEMNKIIEKKQQLLALTHQKEGD